MSVEHNQIYLRKHRNRNVRVKEKQQQTALCMCNCRAENQNDGNYSISYSGLSKLPHAWRDVTIFAVLILSTTNVYRGMLNSNCVYEIRNEANSSDNLYDLLSFHWTVLGLFEETKKLRLIGFCSFFLATHSQIPLQLL